MPAMDTELSRSQQFEKVYKEGQERKRGDKILWNACTVCYLNQGNPSRYKMCYPCWMLVDPDRAFPSQDSRGIHTNHAATQKLLYDRFLEEEASIDAGESSIDKAIEEFKRNNESALQIAPLARSSSVKVGNREELNEAAAADSAWTCEHCGKGDSDPEGTRCGGCGTWRPWTCHVCTLQNICSNLECTACGAKWASDSDPLSGLSPEEQEFIKLEAEAEKARTQGIIDGRKRLDKRLAELGTQEQIMVDDGNCQFRSLSFQLWRTQRYHSHLRSIVIDHMKKRRDDYSFYFFSEEEFDQYLDKMARVTTWGDEMTIRAAADAMGISLYVAQSESGRWILSYEPSTTVEQRTFHLYSPNDANAPPIRAFMSYQAPVHYNSILPNECMDTAYQFLVDSVDCLLVEQRVSHDELMRLEDQCGLEAREASPVHKQVQVNLKKIEKLIEQVAVYNEEQAAEFGKTLEMLCSGVRPPSRAPSVVLSRSMTTPRRPSLESLTGSAVRRHTSISSHLKPSSPTLPDGSPQRVLGDSMSHIEETRSVCDSLNDGTPRHTEGFPREETVPVGAVHNNSLAGSQPCSPISPTNPEVSYPPEVESPEAKIDENDGIQLIAPKVVRQSSSSKSPPPPVVEPRLERTAEELEREEKENRRIQELRKEKVRMAQLDRERREREQQALREKSRAEMEGRPNGTSPTFSPVNATFSRRTRVGRANASSPRPTVCVRSVSNCSASPRSPGDSSAAISHLGTHPKVRAPSAHLMSPIRNVRHKYPTAEEEEATEMAACAARQHSMKKRRPSVKKPVEPKATLASEVRTEPLARNTIIQGETSAAPTPVMNYSPSPEPAPMIPTVASVSYSAAGDDEYTRVDSVQCQTPPQKQAVPISGEPGFVYFVDPESISPQRSYSVSPMYSRGRPTSPQRQQAERQQLGMLESGEMRRVTTSPVHARNDAAKRRALSQLTRPPTQEDRPPSYERPTRCFEARKKGAETLISKLPFSSGARKGLQPANVRVVARRQPTVPFGALKTANGKEVKKSGSTTPRGGGGGAAATGYTSAMTRTHSMQLPPATRTRSIMSHQGRTRLTSGSPVGLANTTGSPSRRRSISTGGRWFSLSPEKQTPSPKKRTSVERTKRKTHIRPKPRQHTKTVAILG